MMRRGVRTKSISSEIFAPPPNRQGGGSTMVLSKLTELYYSLFSNRLAGKQGHVLGPEEADF